MFVLFPRLCYNYVDVQNKKRVELTLHAAGLCSLALHHLEYLSLLGPRADEFIPLIWQINASLGSSHSVQSSVISSRLFWRDASGIVHLASDRCRGKLLASGILSQARALSTAMPDNGSGLQIQFLLRHTHTPHLSRFPSLKGKKTFGFGSCNVYPDSCPVW